MMRDRGVEVVAEFSCILSALQKRAALRHRSGSLEALWTIFLPLTSFFLDVNIRVENIAAWRLAYVVVAAKTRRLQMKSMSLKA